MGCQNLLVAWLQEISVQHFTTSILRYSKCYLIDFCNFIFQGVVHRSLRSSHILISDTGAAVLSGLRWSSDIALRLRFRIFQVLHSIALHWWEQVQPIQLPSPWSSWQPLLACSWNIATESPWLQRDQRHLQLGSHPLWDGKWHCAFQWDAAHLNAVGEVERSRSKTDGCINHGRASCSWRATRTPRCEHIILRWSTFTTSLQDFQATQLTLVWAIVWDLVATLSLAETPSTIRGSSLLNFTTWSLSALCWNPILGHQHLSYLLIPSSGSWRRPTPPCWLYFYPPSLF